MNIRRLITLGLAAVVFTSGSAVLAQRGGAAKGGPAVAQKEDEKRSKNQQEDVNQVSALLTQVTTAQPVTPTSTPAEEKQGEVAISWDSNHFIKGQGGIAYVPFTLSIDRKSLTSANAVVYIRAIDKNAPAPAAAPAGGRPAAPSYAWSDWNFTSIKDDGKLQRAMMLPGGTYDLFVVVKDQFTGDKKQVAKTGLLRRTITVPDYSKPELMTSSILMGDIEQLSSPLNANQQREAPYTFGVMKVTPTATGKIAKTGELALVFWVYGAGDDAITKRPNLTIDYSFYQRNADGTEKYFNKTAPQELNAQTLPPDMDAAQGLPGVMTVPTSALPAADYRLEIKISDKATGKSKVESVNFTVNPS